MTSTGDIEANVRSDIQALRDSPYVRNEIIIIGYKLESGTGHLREVR
jgi:carbonic anhydrase